MTDRDAFIAAIAANPADDLPRLVFADWLDEHGESARAGFIRDQIALAKLRPGTAEYQTLFRRTADTLRANLPGWVQSACDAFGQPTEWKPQKAEAGRFPIWFGSAFGGRPLQRLEFARGFVDQVTLRTVNIEDTSAVDRLFAEHPISRLTCSVPTFHSRWEELATPRLRSVRALHLTAPTTADVTDAVFASPVLDQVTRLTLDMAHRTWGLPATLAERLIRSPMARRLTALRVSTDLVAALHEYPLDDRLQEFAVLPISALAPVQEQPFARLFGTVAELWSALSRVAFRPTLKRLDLTRCGMADDGLAAFARGEEWIRLQGLKLGGNLFGDRGWADFARGWRTPELTYLDASHNWLTDAAAVALARSGMVQTLRVIDLRGNRIGGRGAVALATAVRTGPLTKLLLAGNPLRPKEIAAVRKVLGERTDI